MTFANLARITSHDELGVGKSSMLARNSSKVPVPKAFVRAKITVDGFVLATPSLEQALIEVPKIAHGGNLSDIYIRTQK